jgi:hypothetical protein
MRSGFLNLLVFIAIAFTVYFGSIEKDSIFSSISVGAGFLIVAFHYMSHHYDFSKRINQIFIVSCLLMVLPGILQNINVQENDYKTIFSIFYTSSYLLLISIFWFEDHAKEYNKSLLILKICLFVVGFSFVNVASPQIPIYKNILGVLLGLALFIAPNFFLRWKYQNTRNFRFGLVAGTVLILSLIQAALDETTNSFLPVGALNIFGFYLVSVPFIKEKILPNWLVLRFRNSEKTKRRIRRRERFRYKRAMEKENN